MSEVIYRAPDDKDAYIERHELPNGTEVFYKDGRDLHSSQAHSYWERHTGELSCSGRIPGISTVAKNDGDTDNDALLNWAARLAYEGVAREVILRSLRDDDGSWLGSATEIERVLTREKLLWSDVRDAKGKIGTLSHNVLQALCEGAIPIVRNGYDRAVVDWWETRDPQILDSERVVYSAEHSFAGRFDIRAIIRGDCDAPYAIPDLAGKSVLGDAKTSGYISNSFHIQAEGYEIGCVETEIGDTDLRLILQLREDGTWHEWEGHGEADDFLAALNTYTRGKRISSKARKDWRDWKQATEAAAA